MIYRPGCIAFKFIVAVFAVFAFALYGWGCFIRGLALECVLGRFINGWQCCKAEASLGGNSYLNALDCRPLICRFSSMLVCVVKCI